MANRGAGSQKIMCRMVVAVGWQGHPAEGLESGNPGNQASQIGDDTPGWSGGWGTRIFWHLGGPGFAMAPLGVVLGFLGLGTLMFASLEIVGIDGSIECWRSPLARGDVSWP